MPIPKLLLCIATLILFFNGKPVLDLASCDTFKVAIDKSKDPTSADLFKVSINASGGSTPYHYVFLDTKGKPISLDNSQKDFKNIKPGSYRCIVVDNQDCKKDFYVEIN